MEFLDMQFLRSANPRVKFPASDVNVRSFYA
jgi:hypothetical protein